MRPATLATTLLAVTVSASVAAAAQDENAAVLGAVQQFFDTMASKDVAGASEVLDPEGSFVSIRWEDGEPVVRRSSNRDYLDGLAAGQAVYLERMWDPTVLIHGPIAIVWTQYDFYRDGELSHCGVDAFQLLKSDAGWKITGGTYTVERGRCEESPLGPPASRVR